MMKRTRQGLLALAVWLMGSTAWAQVEGVTVVCDPAEAMVSCTATEEPMDNGSTVKLDIQMAPDYAVYRWTSSVKGVNKPWQSYEGFEKPNEPLTLTAYAGKVVTDEATKLTFITVKEPADGQPGEVMLGDNRTLEGTVEVPETVTAGGKTYRMTGVAFQAMTEANVAHMVLPKSTERIETRAFSGTWKLKSVNFTACPELKFIGTNAFYRCGFDVIDLSACTKLETMGIEPFKEQNYPEAFILPAAMDSLDLSWTNASSFLGKVVVPNAKTKGRIYLGDSYTNLKGMDLGWVKADTTHTMRSPIYHLTLSGQPGRIEIVSDWGKLRVVNVGAERHHYEVKANNPEGGTVKQSSVDTEGGMLLEGQAIYMTATPKEGYKFAGWVRSDNEKLDDEDQAENTAYMGNEDVTFTAMFHKSVVSADSLAYLVLKEPAGEVPGEVMVGHNDSVKLHELTIPASISTTEGDYTVVAVGENAFSSVDSLRKVTLPATIREIRMKAFTGCKNLKEVDLTACKALETIGKEAFAYNRNLKVLNMDACEALENISSFAFYNCIVLNEIDFTKLTNLRLIGRNAFYQCRSLTWVDLSACQNLERIGDNAFESCKSLKGVSLAGLEKLKHIEADLFGDCRKLEGLDVTGCKGVDMIQHGTLKGTGMLTELDLTGLTGAKTFSSEICDYENKWTTLMLPKGMKDYNRATSKLDSLKSLTVLNKDMEGTMTWSGSLEYSVAPGMPKLVTFEKAKSGRTLIRFGLKTAGRTRVVSADGRQVVDLAIGGYALDMPAEGLTTMANGEAYVMPKKLTGGVVTVKNGQAVVDYCYPAGAVVPAGMALVIKGEQGAYLLTVADTEGEVNANELKGVRMGGKVMPAKGGRICVLGRDAAGKPGFFVAEAPQTEPEPEVKAAETDQPAEPDFGVRGLFGQAYLDVPAELAEKGLTLVDAKDLTGIEETATADEVVPANKKGIYTLEGVKLDVKAADLPAGVYVVDGRKVVLN